MKATRADMVRAIVEKTGDTEEQAEAFIDIVGSAFARRGWIEGEPLSPEELEYKLKVFLGEKP